MQKAVVLLSGGLDSSTCLAIAKQQGFDCHALSFDYGQKHSFELKAAQRVAQSLDAKKHHVFPLNLSQFGGSALTDIKMEVPAFNADDAIPITYVPARNTVFLSIALALAESIGSHDIFIGVSAIDYSGYPDCRPEYIDAFTQMANLATKAGVEGKKFAIHTPLLQLTKAQTIEKGIQLGVDYSMTVSCYQTNTKGQACGLCDSCVLRKKGFEQAKCPDATSYIS